MPIHAGLRWCLECEPFGFVLRDRRHPTSSVRRFPRTEPGWNEYLRLEAWHRPGWPTRGPWILANLIIGSFGVSFAVFGV